MDKRGQAALFVIVGLVIVVAFLILASFIDLSAVSPVASNTEKIRAQVEDCILESAKDAVDILSFHGGYIDEQADNVDGITYFLLGNKLNYQDFNSLGEQISGYINPSLGSCLFNEQGMTINDMPASTMANVFNDKIIVNVDYPITLLSSDREEIVNPEYNIEIISKLGKLYNIAYDIAGSYKDITMVDTTSLNAYGINITLIPAEDNSLIYLLEDEGEQFIFAVK